MKELLIMRKTALFNIAKNYRFDFAMRGNVCRLDGNNASIQLEFDDAGNVDYVTLITDGWTYNFENAQLFDDINAFLPNVQNGNTTANRHIIRRFIVALNQYPGTDDFISVLEDLA